MKDDRLCGPLTVERLKKMCGKWVWIVTTDKDMAVAGWAYVGREHVYTGWEFEGNAFVGRAVYSLRKYGEWFAYSYPKASLDPCELCRTFSGDVIFQISTMNDYDQSTTSRYVSALFCPRCGRPLWKNEFAGGSDKHETVDK